jgi:hypothetical protein
MGALVQLACDGVQPLWLARLYGVPLGSAHRSTRRLEGLSVPFVAWSKGEAALHPRHLRHALGVAVLRRLLEAPPEAWDSLAVRSGRRSLRGRAWARGLALSGRRIHFRPDAEWWRLPGRPVAVELDLATIRLSRVRERLERWSGVYDGVVWVVASERRGASVVDLYRASVRERQGIDPPPGAWLSVWLLRGWETGGDVVWKGLW